MLRTVYTFVLNVIIIKNFVIDSLISLLTVPVMRKQLKLNNRITFLRQKSYKKIR